MINKKLNNLQDLIKVNVMPLLIEDRKLLQVYITEFNPNKIVLDAKFSAKDLEIDGSTCPKWLKYLDINKNSSSNLLIIDNFCEISKQEQMKFYDLLKYRKVANYELPTNCFIIIMGKSEEINEIIFSLLSIIK